MTPDQKTQLEMTRDLLAQHLPLIRQLADDLGAAYATINAVLEAPPQGREGWNGTPAA